MKRRKKKMRCNVLSLLVACLVAAGWITTGLAAEAVYVGTQTCGNCHEDQLRNFTALAKKSHSFESVLKMAKGLTPQEQQGCYACHTTGYGKTGGFVSAAKTPALSNTGCEVCHGPGSVHADSQDPADIKAKPVIEDCKDCHNAERVGAFRYKPLLFGGAH